MRMGLLETVFSVRVMAIAILALAAVATFAVSASHRASPPGGVRLAEAQPDASAWLSVRFDPSLPSAAESFTRRPVGEEEACPSF